MLGGSYLLITLFTLKGRLSPRKPWWPAQSHTKEAEPMHWPSNLVPRSRPQNEQGCMPWCMWAAPSCSRSFLRRCSHQVGLAVGTKHPQAEEAPASCCRYCTPNTPCRGGAWKKGPTDGKKMKDWFPSTPQQVQLGIFRKQMCQKAEIVKYRSLNLFFLLQILSMRTLPHVLRKEMK